VIAMTADARTYRLEPRDTTGVLLGLSAGQCLLAGGGLAAGVVLTTAGVSILVSVITVALCAAIAFGRYRGTPLWNWVVVAVTWRSARRRRHWRTDLWSALGPAPSPPPCLAGLTITTHHDDGQALGVIEDRQRHTLTAAFAVHGGEFLLEDPTDQEHLLARWGEVLGQFASDAGVVSHLAWSVLSQPSGLQLHRAWLEIATPESHDGDRPRSSYKDLVDAAPARAMTHQIVVTVTVSAARLPRARAQAGPPAARLHRALLTALAVLQRSLTSAGLTATTPFDADSLIGLLRAHVDPLGPRPLPGQETPRGRRRLGDLGGAAPQAIQASWDHLQLDGTFQRTWWIADWPRHALPAAWLEPALTATAGVTRTTTLHLAPVSAYQSRRRIERDLIKLESEAASREEKGRRVDARHRRATQAILDREHEIVAGYPEVAYLGLITVAAASLDALEADSEILEQEARSHGLELRVLYARQDLAWAAALPFGLAPHAAFTG
jgi:hypothetical protein